MIKFELKCDSDHRFEGWFRDGAAFEAQAEGHEILCPLCGSHSVSKALMAPRIGRGGPSPEDIAQAKMVMLSQLQELRKTIEANSDYVGPRFAEEARKIHYGEVDPKPIYGEATEAEAAELADEGVEVARIPWIPLAN